MKKYLIAGLVIASTHKCSIVAKKPDGKTLTMLGTDGFKTKSDAHSAMKGMTECNT
jgi:hypothetical protein